MYTSTLVMQEANGTLALEVPLTIQVAEDLQTVFLPTIVQ
jgi:hypothetical protein